MNGEWRLDFVMTALEGKSQGGSEQVEIFLRFSRRGLAVTALAIVFLWATVLAVAFWPGSRLAQWPTRFPLLFPILVLLAVMALRLAGGPRRWRPESRVAKLILNDEFRRANLLRAQRVALFVVAVAQVPMGLLAMHLPTARAVLAMAGTTIALALVTVVALFLFFDRE